MTDWKPGDPLHARPFGTASLPIVDIKSDHLCAASCRFFTLSGDAARWPTPFADHDLGPWRSS